MTACRFCGKDFSPPLPQTTHCRSCHFSGALQAEAHAGLLSELHEVVGVNEVRFEHTGGGCWGLAITFPDGRFGFATEAIQESDGSWSAECVCPDRGDPWALGIYSSEEGFWNGEEATVGPNRHQFFSPLTDAEMVDKIRKEVGA